MANIYYYHHLLNQTGASLPSAMKCQQKERENVAIMQEQIGINYYKLMVFLERLINYVMGGITSIM